MRFLLDEGVPVSVGRALESAGHEVVFFNNSGLSKGTPDSVVCAAAEANNAILVAADNDMKTLARGHGITKARYKSMGLLKLDCPEPVASTRVEAALSLIEHEWEKVGTHGCTRLYVTIGGNVIRTHR